jgi:zinc protease
VPANRLALPLWLWSDEMAFFDAALDDAAIASARTRLREQRRSVLDGSPLGRLELIAHEEMLPAEHPHRKALLLPESVDRVERADIVAFHDRWLTPGHATLVVVGDVVADDAFALVERYFGSIPGSPAPRAAPPPPVRLKGETRVDVAANVPRASVSVRWPTPRDLTSDDARLDLVARLLAGWRTAWLYWKLVDQQKIATSLRCRERSADVASIFEITADAAPGHTPAEVLAAIDAALDEARTATPTQTQIDHASYELVAGRLAQAESASTRAGDFAKFATLVGTPDYLAHDLERYDRVSDADIRATIARWLPADRRVVLLVTPAADAASGGERRARTFVPAVTP